MPGQPEPLFITDDEILTRLQQVENGLAHLEASIPAMRREVAAIRKGLEPRGGDAR